MPSFQGAVAKERARSAAGESRTPGFNRLQQAQADVYGNPAVETRDSTSTQAAQYLAKIQNLPKGKDRDRALKEARNLYDAIDPEDRKAYNLQPPEGHKGSGGILGAVGRAVESIPGAKTTLNVLGRPAEAVEQLVMDAKENAGTWDTLTHVGRALKGDYQPGGKHQAEAVAPTQILHGRDYVPHGKGDAILDFAGDTLLDPTTYLTFGASAGAKAGLAALLREGVEEGAVKAITQKGLTKALAEGAGGLTEESLRATLLKAAQEGGSKFPEKLVERQISAMRRTAEGGARLAGAKIPGTKNLLKGNQLVGEATKMSDRFAEGGILNRAAEAGHEVRTKLSDVVSNRAGVRRELGKIPAEELGAAQHGSRAVTEGIVTESDQVMREGFKGVTKSQLDKIATSERPDATLRELLPKGADATEKVTENARRLNDQFGGLENVDEILAQHADNPALGAHRAVQAVARRAGIASLVDELPSVGLGKTVDDVLGAEPALVGIGGETPAFAQSVGQTAQPDLFGTMAGTQVADNTDRLALASEAAARQGLVPMTAKNGKTIFVSPSVQEEIAKFSTRITSDEGVRVLRDGYRHLLRQWKTAATVLPVSPAFFSRNAQGNLILMVGKGFSSPEVFPSAMRIERALAKDSFEKLSPQLRTAAESARDLHIADAGQALRELGTGSEDIERMLTKGGVKRGRLARGYTKATDAGTALNKRIEDTSRIAMFLDGLGKGMTPAEAAKRVEDALFNYADITKGDEIIKQAVPFYTFMKKNLEHQANMLTTAPGKVTAQVHGMDAAAEAFGDPNKELPTWAVMAGYLPFGGGIAHVDTPLLSAAETVAPFTELANVLPGGAPVDVGSLVGKGILGPMGGPAPGLLKAGVEAKTGQSLFTGGPVHDGMLDNPVVGNLVPSGGRLTGTIDNAKAVNNGDLKGLLPLVGLSAKSNGATEQENILLGRLIEAKAATDDIPLPLLNSLRRAGLVPPKVPSESRLASLSPRDRRRAERQYLRDVRQYQRTIKHPNREQKSLLAGLKAGPLPAVAEE